MITKILNLKTVIVLLVIGLFYLINASTSFAAPNPPCVSDDPRVECKFGTISPPPAIAPFLEKNPTGSGAISQFLSNLVTLIFSVAGIALIFMLLWGAFEWMISGGDKEKIASARSRIMNAFIGIILFALAFAIIRVLGTFTGFTFFVGS